MLPSRTALLLGTIFSVILAGVAHHIPTRARRQTSDNQCTNPIVRKEWRSLSSEEKQSYLSAVQCLARLPAKTPPSVNAEARSRFDDFVLSHSEETLAGNIHFTARFLPYHRYLTALFEKALREECSYTGSQPYWDWTLDAAPLGNFIESPIFNPNDGFGGNGIYEELPNNFDGDFIPGRSGGGCITDGPFVNFTSHLYPESYPSPRCIRRDFSAPFADENSAGVYVEQILRMSSRYSDLAWYVENGVPGSPGGAIHAGTHYAVGGSLGTLAMAVIAAEDPLFYVHHANIDRVWASWQRKDKADRLHDMDGALLPYDYENQRGGRATLETPLNMRYAGQSITVADIMNTTAGILCYDYDKDY